MKREKSNANPPGLGDIANQPKPIEEATVRHAVELQEEFCSQLQQLKLEDIAKLAAHFRGDSRTGSATKAIRRWVVANKTEDEVHEYDGHYRLAWRVERKARLNRSSARPTKRPCTRRRVYPKLQVALPEGGWGDEPLARHTQNSAYA